MMYARIENGAIVNWASTLPENREGDWRPLSINYPTFNQKTHQVGDPSDTIEANRVLRTWVVSPRTPTVDDVETERKRRLSIGFDYNFGDARGVHRIGTTESDMKGWDEVSKYAGALIDAGQQSTPISIATNTGVCTVTPIEWRAIEIASAAFRQPLWAASFALMATDPIPASYADDSYWS